MCDTAGSAVWVDSGSVQGLGRIDIAYTDDNLAIHQQCFDRGAARSGTSIQIISIKFGA
jgi:hypothetical protein